MKSIAVIGLGYVGLPLSLQFARSGFTVIGLDFGCHTASIALWHAEKDITEVIADDLGLRTIPVAVAFRGEEIITGTPLTYSVTISITCSYTYSFNYRIISYTTTA